MLDGFGQPERHGRTGDGRLNFFLKRVRRFLHSFFSESSNLISSASLAASVAAVAVSLVTYNNAEERRKRDLPFELMPKAYEKYYEMNKIQLDKFYLAHMFADPDLYAEVKSQVQQATPGLSTEKKLEYVLHERAVADFIFEFYEQVLFQWEATRDTEREFIRETVDYLRKFARNPRLVYWWHENGAGLKASAREKTQRDWDEHVLGRSNTGKFEWCDALGPFAIDTRPPARRSAFGSC